MAAEIQVLGNIPELKWNECKNHPVIHDENIVMFFGLPFSSSVHICLVFYILGTAHSLHCRILQCLSSGIWSAFLSQLFNDGQLEEGFLLFQLSSITWSFNQVLTLPPGRVNSFLHAPPLTRRKLHSKPNLPFSIMFYSLYEKSTSSSGRLFAFPASIQKQVWLLYCSVCARIWGNCFIFLKCIETNKWCLKKIYIFCFVQLYQ